MHRPGALWGVIRMAFILTAHYLTLSSAVRHLSEPVQSVVHAQMPNDQTGKALDNIIYIIRAHVSQDS
jgi:hypothetical protein